MWIFMTSYSMDMFKKSITEGPTRYAFITRRFTRGNILVHLLTVIQSSFF